MRSTNDELALLQKGDEEAMRRWFDAHVDGLFAFVYARVNRNREVARDVTQGVFEQAARRIKDFDPQRGTMPTWLRTLALNPIRRAQTRFKREGAMPATDTLHAQWAEADSRDLPPETLVRAETRELVDQTLQNLPDHYRSVLRSRYLEDASLSAIAAEQNRKVTAIKPLLHRARQAFRDEFQRLINAQAHATPFSP